jgi:hypothetical protein
MGSSTESNAYKPLSASPERRREHAHKKLQSKAWATTLNKTDPSWPNGQTARHAKASSGKGYISLLQLTLITFNHFISQVEVVNIKGLHPILSMQLW